MSDNIPFDIQREIIKRVSNIKSLIRFRSVSKRWKSFIDSSEFIKGYGARNTQPHSRILTYRFDYFSDDLRYICLVEDDTKIFKVQQQELAPFVMSPSLKQYDVLYVVGVCHGLLCFHGYNKDSYKQMLVIWNLSIGKSFGIALVRNDKSYFGFGVCPVTRDPTVVKFVCGDNKPWHVEVFTLSSGVWNVIPSGDLPGQSIQLNKLPTQVVIDRFIYWGAHEETFTDDGESTTNHMIVSFDLITKKFKVIDLLDTLTNEFFSNVSVFKLRGSLVVSTHILVERDLDCGVWVMEHDSSFRKLFTIGNPYYRILGFRRNGEPIFETREADDRFTTLNVYEPRLQQIKKIKNLGISALGKSIFMGSYKESLLLLDHSDSHTYCDDS